MTATFLLVRHGAHTDFDIRLSGRRPGVALSATGQAQVAALGRRLADTGLARVMCSPLQRTVETAQAIATACGLAAPQTAEALIELDLGDWTGRDFASLKGDPAWDRWNDERQSARPPGGESMTEAQARIVGWLQSTAATAGDERIAVVTHSDMIRGAVAAVIGLPLQHLCAFDIDPASVSTVVMGDWGARLLHLNVGEDAARLPSSQT